MVNEWEGGADFGGEIGIDFVGLAAVVLVVLVGLAIVVERQGGGEPVAQQSPVTFTAVPSSSGVQSNVESQIKIQTANPLRLASPYNNYVLTQGPHGFSYGHMAIDIAAGKGTPIVSPIDGQVAAVFVDGVGNTTIVLENGQYEVTMLHGNYTVQAGQNVRQGEVVGTEGNNGYTTDMSGRLCTNRDCGYHTHLNVFDKSIQRNVNPLDLIGG